MKFHETPILKTLEDYLSNNPIRMHVPFHTGIPNNAVFPKDLYKLDISEVSGYDMEGEDTPIFQSEKITANLFGAKHSFYLTGGASVGLLASLIALNKHGKKVILARNVHKSVINGIVLSGLEPIWLDVDFLDEWGIFSKINPPKLEKVIKENKDIAGCVIVSPTYEGVISDVKKIAEICHKRNIPLIVDEAHGAHLHFLNDKNLCSAIGLKADIVIQSWHKSLGSLTQSGVLHLVNNDFFNYHDIKRSLDLVTSTSPSFLLLLSLELTRKHLAETKGEYFRGLYNLSVIFRKKIKEMKHLSCFINDDPFKVYLKPENTSGIGFAFNLYKDHGIEVESANELGFLMMLGVSFNDEIKNKIVKALNEISHDRGLINQTPTNETQLKPSTFTTNGDLRKIFLQGFQDKQNKEYNYDVNAPCPPGYVINVPGTRKCK